MLYKCKEYPEIAVTILVTHKVIQRYIHSCTSYCLFMLFIQPSHGWVIIQTTGIHQQSNKSVWLSIVLVLFEIVPFHHKIFDIRWQVIEDFDPSIVCTFLKAWEVSSWFMKTVLVSCVKTVKTVYICIGLKTFNVIYDDVYKRIYIYSHGRDKICNLLNRSLQELWDLTPIMILTVFLCNVNTFLLLDELPQKIIPYFIKEWK
jgi:hypothetical protein